MTLVPTSDPMTELARCVESPRYFIVNYCKIYDAESGGWILFRLWNEQVQVLDTVHHCHKLIVLKARQVGLTWLLGIAYPLWLMIFRPAATVLLFSKRDDEAVYLLSEERFRGMYNRLPDWLRNRTITRDDAHVFAFGNGSVARAFPTTAGDSYTATYALVDEADLVPNLGKLLLSVKPTVDMGGTLILLSKADKSQPQSQFKSIYRNAKSGHSNGWKHIFLPWWVRPGRTQAWYDAERQNTIKQTGSDDDMKENYPAKDTEALSPRMLDKRLPSTWLEPIYSERESITPAGMPAIANLTVYAAPEPGVHYVAGADCAEGLPGSDDSVTQVICQDTGEQVAKISGKIPPEQHAHDTFRLCEWYNRAKVLPERNNHGHSFINTWRMLGGGSVLRGIDKRPGWQTNSLSKAILYNNAADSVRDGGAVLHDFQTFTQLTTIERDTLSAPTGLHDDEAIAFVLALMAAKRFITSIPLVDFQ